MLQLGKRENVNFGDLHELIPIEDIVNGEIICDGRKIIVLKIEPTNFKLKTRTEQMSILEGYKTFLKRCGFDMQILIQTKKKDMSRHIEKVKKNIFESDCMREIIDDYIAFINQTISNKEILSREFFIVLDIQNDECAEEKMFKVRECLKGCDNEVRKCETEEVIGVFKNSIRKDRGIYV